MRHRGRPIRGFVAGLLLGIFLSLDLALMGAVKVESAVLTILPAALAVLGLILGGWAPLGRAKKPPKKDAPTLPAPVTWPESESDQLPSAPPPPLPFGDPPA